MLSVGDARLAGKDTSPAPDRALSQQRTGVSTLFYVADTRFCVNPPVLNDLGAHTPRRPDAGRLRQRLHRQRNWPEYEGLFAMACSQDFDPLLMKV